jgi:hypothetical protein
MILAEGREGEIRKERDEVLWKTRKKEERIFGGIVGDFWWKSVELWERSLSGTFKDFQ